MKLRTKIIIFCILIAVVTIIPIFFYVFYQTQINLIAEKKQNSQIMIDTVYHALEGQYTNAMNQQLIDVFSIKNSLRDTASVFTYFHRKYVGKNTASDKELEEFLRNNQTALMQQDTALITFRHGKFWGSEQALNLLDAKTINKNNLQELIVGDLPSNGTYDIAKKDSHTYLAYIFSPDRHGNSNGGFNYAMLKNIDLLSSAFDQIDQEMLVFLKEMFDNLPAEKTMPMYLLDEEFNILLTNDPQGTIGAKFKHYQAHDAKLHDEKERQKHEHEHEHEHGQNQEICNVIENDYVCFQYLKPLKLHVASMQPMSSLRAYGDKIISGLAAIGTLVLMLMVLVSISYATRITRSLNDIAGIAHKIAVADLSNPDILKEFSYTPSDSSDEVGNLSQAIANMRNSLISNINSLVNATAKQNRLEGELGVANDIQMGMLPNNESIKKSDLYEIAAFINPAKQVGGDFYDVFGIDEDRLVITVGDVSDKGVPAAMYMSICVTLLRQICKMDKTPDQVTEILNRCLCERNPNMMFATLFLMIINTRTGEFVYTNAGHCQPAIIRKSEVFELEDLSGPAVGVAEEAKYTTSRGSLAPGDYMVIYTDGISEAQNESGEFFNTERIIETLKKHKFNTANSLLYSLLDDVLDFRQNAEQSDDMTLLCYRRLKAGVEGGAK